MEEEKFYYDARLARTNTNYYISNKYEKEVSEILKEVKDAANSGKSSLSIRKWNPSKELILYLPEVLYFGCTQTCNVGIIITKSYILDVLRLAM